MWAGLTGSPIVDIRQVRPGQNSVNYVCKYLRKQAYCSFTTRRVSWTRGFFPAELKTDQIDWKLIDKEHLTEHPATTIVEDWGPNMIYRVGPYAWTNQNPGKQVGPAAP